MTLSPSGGDDTAAIQAALDNCPPGMVVQLTAGTFNIYSIITINNSNVTLRGAGPGTGASGGIHAPSDGNGAGSVLVGGGTGTFIVNQNRTDSNHGLLQISAHSMNDILASINLASDAVQGAYSVTLTSNPGIAAGELVLVDENTDNDPDVYWGELADPPGGNSRSWFSRQDRSLAQMMRVSAVNGSTITFDTPFRHTLSVANQAQLTRFSTPSPTGVGVEEIALMGGMGGWGNLTMTRCSYCWVEHVESYYAKGPSIWVMGSYRSEIRDSYIHESPLPEPGGGGYLLAIDYGSADILVENNIISNGNKVIVMRASGGGNVIAYNYMDDAWGETYPDEMEAGLNAGHYTTPHMELLEGNYAFGYKGDTAWGNSIDITVFRNQFSAKRAAAGWLATYTVSDGTGGLIPYADYGGTTGRNAVDVQAAPPGSPGTLRNNFIGNILGYQGQTLLPQYTNGNWADAAQAGWAFETLGNFPAAGIVSMWVFGSYQTPPNSAWTWNSNSYQTHIRDGNWDWYTRTQTWLGLGGTQANPLGTPKPIPNSLYLKSAPAFFSVNSYGANTWPWVDPSTGTTYKLPAKARFDAGTPNLL
jgi:hypothetical protein